MSQSHRGGHAKRGFGRVSPFFLRKVSLTQALLSGSVVSKGRLKDKPDIRVEFQFYGPFARKTREKHTFTNVWGVFFPPKKKSPPWKFSNTKFFPQGLSPLVLGAAIPWIVFAIGFKPLMPGVWKPGKTKKTPQGGGFKYVLFSPRSLGK